MSQIHISRKLDKWLKERGYDPGEIKKGDWYVFENRKGVWLLDSDQRLPAIREKATKLVTYYDIIIGRVQDFWGKPEPVFEEHILCSKETVPCCSYKLSRLSKDEFKSYVYCGFCGCKMITKEVQYRETDPVTGPTRYLLSLLQQNKLKEIEDYVMKCSVFTN